MSELGKILVAFGLLMLIVGGTLLLVGNLSGKVPWLGRLPGDIDIERGNWRIYAPIGTCVLISIVLSVLFSLFGRR